MSIEELRNALREAINRKRPAKLDFGAALAELGGVDPSDPAALRKAADRVKKAQTALGKLP